MERFNSKKERYLDDLKELVESRIEELKWSYKEFERNLELICDEGFAIAGKLYLCIGWSRDLIETALGYFSLEETEQVIIEFVDIVEKFMDLIERKKKLLMKMQRQIKKWKKKRWKRRYKEYFIQKKMLVEKERIYEVLNILIMFYRGFLSRRGRVYRSSCKEKFENIFKKYKNIFWEDKFFQHLVDEWERLHIEIY